MVENQAKYKHSRIEITEAMEPNMIKEIIFNLQKKYTKVTGFVSKQHVVIKITK